MIANILSLFTLTQGVLVTETNYKYTTVTVYAPVPTGYEYDLSNSTSGINGTFPNGTFANGTYPNGTYLNGTYANGTFANGTAHNVTLDNLTNYANSTALTSEIYTAISTYETSPEAPQYSEVSLTSETPAPAPETTIGAPAPAPETTTVAPAPETTTEAPAPAPETTTEAPAPAPETTTEAPSPAPETTTEAPAPETTTEAPAPETTTEQPAQTTENSQSSQSDSQVNSQQLDSFAQGIIDYHNSVRAEHSASALTWNQDLANYAQRYLDGSQCNFAHSGGPYGENIALGYSIHDAMVAWYDEYQQYDYAAGQFSSATGHFTQMVWKDTTEVGCATINCDGWGPYLACEYTPRGNIIGEFTSNVLAN